MTGEPFRFAIVGAGAIANAHVDGMLARPGVAEVVAVCDPRPEGIANLHARIPGARGFSSIDDLIGAGGFDAAIIATPHHLHLEQAMAFVTRGIPVLVEKPVVSTTADVRELAAASEVSGAYVLPGQTRRFIRETRWARAALDADPGLVGEVTTFSLQSFQDIRAYTRGANHWLLDAKLAGGGVVISLAIHQLDLVRYLSGSDYVRVSAAAQYEPPFINGAESTMAATLELGNGGVGTMQASYAATKAPFGESLTIIGRYGSIAQHARHIGDTEGPVMISSAHGAAPTVGKDQYDGWAEVEPPAGLETLDVNPFGNEQRHLIDVVRGDGEPVVTLANNFNTIACIEALMQSAREGRSVQVEQW
ncbi:Gfo/Idh/MocA family protein [Frigoribacterium faeni]|uniref:Gfo/Idh/MocA family protein n=1 Tax=Frigoribacterium faeni TaxID=145483 RepID=UPI00241360CB|nr:Gfo/Idh/MocA family oxidoreductase [Frigoribacterium faeni]